MLELPVASFVVLPVGSSPPLRAVFSGPAHTRHTHITRIRNHVYQEEIRQFCSRSRGIARHLRQEKERCSARHPALIIDWLIGSAVTSCSQRQIEGIAVILLRNSRLGLITPSCVTRLLNSIKLLTIIRLR